MCSLAHTILNLTLVTIVLDLPKLCKHLRRAWGTCISAKVGKRIPSWHVLSLNGLSSNGLYNSKGDL